MYYNLTKNIYRFMGGPITANSNAVSLLQTESRYEYGAEWHYVAHGRREGID